jgi:hypothetical protein
VLRILLGEARGSNFGADFGNSQAREMNVRGLAVDRLRTITAPHLYRGTEPPITHLPRSATIVPQRAGGRFVVPGDSKFGFNMH